jgi:hypothetical protein
VCQEEIATSTADISIVKECSLSKYTEHWFALVLLCCTYLTVSTLMYWSVFPLLDLTWINLAICPSPFELNRVTRTSSPAPAHSNSALHQRRWHRMPCTPMRGPRHRYIIGVGTHVQHRLMMAEQCPDMGQTSPGTSLIVTRNAHDRQKTRSAS